MGAGDLSRLKVDLAAAKVILYSMVLAVDERLLIVE